MGTVFRRPRLGLWFILCASLLLCLVFASQPASAIGTEPPTDSPSSSDTVDLGDGATPVEENPPVEAPAETPVVEPVEEPVVPPVDTPAPPVVEPVPAAPTQPNLVIDKPPVEEVPAEQPEVPAAEEQQSDDALSDEPAPEPVATHTKTAVATPSAKPTSAPKATTTSGAVPVDKSAADIHKVVHIKKGSPLTVQLVVVGVLLLLGYGYFRAMRHTRPKSASRNGK